jgi:seryl-tRNA synthetase
MLSPFPRLRYPVPPMHDLNYFRENLPLFERMAAQRRAHIDFDAFRALDRERREAITAGERLKADRNRASEEIARRKRAGEDAADLLAEMKRVSDEIKRADEQIAAFDARLQDFMLAVPNLPHASVPVGSDASANVEVRRWGTPPKFDFTPRPHWEIGERAGILDLPRAAKIAGTRLAVYRGLGARLERALANFFLDQHTRNGYTEYLPPFLVNTASLTGAGQLPKLADDMFHLENTDLWLSPTAEVQLSNLFRDETLDADLLPIKSCAWTACFRSEAGAAGRDTRGIVRQQFFQAASS